MSLIMRSGAVAASSLLFIGLAVTAGAAQGTQAGNTGTQTGQSTSSSQAAQNGGQAGTMTIRQGIQNNLQQAGYTDVTVMPSSFLVHAKDKQGHAVAMVIGPDTFTEVTELPTGNGASQAGSAAGSGGNAPASKP